MKSFPIDLEDLLTIAAGVLDATGILLEANAGFLHLLPPGCSQPIGSKVSRFFIQPDFATFVALQDGHGHAGYQGLITIGDYAAKTRALRGRVWRTTTGIRVLAEYDIIDLERLNDAMLDINRDASAVQDTLARANVALKQREVQSVEASLTDVLTGVGNRRKLNQALTTEISRVRRNQGKLSAIMIDVDHFKRVNDEYGHSAGDKVLARCGALLKSHTRPTDIVARFGGEEFMVLLPHTNLAQALIKAEQLRSVFAAEPFAPLTRSLTSSFGVTELLREENSESFLSRVDGALYQAKAEGRNRVVAAGAEPKV